MQRKSIVDAGSLIYDDLDAGRIASPLRNGEGRKALSDLPQDMALPHLLNR